MKKHITLFLGLIAVSSAFADINNINGKINAIKAAEKACFETATNTMSMNTCSSDMYASADKLLNEFYQDRVQILKQGIESEKSLSDFEKVSQETLKRLTLAQRAWITFRDADCNLQSAQMLNGTGEGQIYGGCVSAKTLQRVEDLVKQFQTEN